MKNKNKIENSEIYEELERKFAESNANAAELIVELEDKNEQLAKTTSELKTLANIVEDSLNEIFIFNSQDLKIQYINKESLRNLGYSKDEAFELRPWDLLLEYTPPLFKRMLQDLKDGKKQQLKMKTTQRRKDGSLYPVEVLLESCHFHGEEAFFATILNREQERKLAQELERTSKLASIGELAAGVGHEINNPLTIAFGNIGILRSILLGEKMNEEIFDPYIEKIKNSLERIRRIVDGLRTYARSDEEEDDVFSVPTAVEQTYFLINEVYANKGVRVNLVLPKNDFFIRGSLGKFQQSLMILISNARDAIEDKAMKKINIFVEKTSRGDEAHIIVKDNGMGIETSHLKKIFHPFFTTKKAGKGTGMGLDLAKTFISQFKGSLSATSKLGIGSEFSIKIPLSNEVHSPSSQVLEENPSSAIISSLRVLIIDDEGDVRNVLKIFLEQYCTSIKEADGGDSALELIYQEEFDLIFTDLKMPDINGIEFIHQAQKKMGGELPPIAVITGGTSKKESQILVKDLADIVIGQILKPFGHKDVQKILSLACELKEKKAA